MISLLARIFRAVCFMMGISAPPPGEEEGRFVLLWLGITGFIVLFSVLLFYGITRLYVP